MSRAIVARLMRRSRMKFLKGISRRCRVIEGVQWKEATTALVGPIPRGSRSDRYTEEVARRVNGPKVPEQCTEPRLNSARTHRWSTAPLRRRKTNVQLWERRVRLAAGLQSLEVIVALATIRKTRRDMDCTRRQLNSLGVFSCLRGWCGKCSLSRERPYVLLCSSDFFSSLVSNTLCVARSLGVSRMRYRFQRLS